MLEIQGALFIMVITDMVIQGKASERKEYLS